MFETSVQEKRSGALWGVITALLVLVVTLSAGYFIVT